MNVKDGNVAIFQLELTFALPARTNSYALIWEAKKKEVRKAATIGDYETTSLGRFNSNLPTLSKPAKVP